MSVDWNTVGYSFSEDAAVRHLLRVASELTRWLSVNADFGAVKASV